MLSGTALRSTRAGFAAVFLVSLVFATFGSWFNLFLAYLLMLGSMTMALVGLWRADRAAHEAARNPAMTNGIYARSGAALSVVALLLSAYYTGLLVVVVFLWPVTLLGLLMVCAIHRARLDADEGPGARA